MYRTREDKLNVEGMLAKLKNTPSSFPSITYANADKTKARKVLDKLLSAPSTNELLSITIRT